MIDVNDIENRIAVLYRVTDSFVKMKPVRSMHIEEKEDKSDPTGRRFSVEFGGGPTSEEDLINVQVTLNNIVHHLANLKDNLKKRMRDDGLQPNKVEDQINSDIKLQLITDLCNQEKHGYPLTKSKRSGLDPIITNIRHELAIPLTIGFSNAFTDSSVVVEADVVDGSGSHIMSFREMVEGAIKTWENFCLAEISSSSQEIAYRRANERKQEDWATQINGRHYCPVNVWLDMA